MLSTSWLMAQVCDHLSKLRIPEPLPGGKRLGAVFFVQHQYSIITASGGERIGDGHQKPVQNGLKLRPLARPTGLEPVTYGFEDRHSIH